jgi:pSer/pThr/pTyr-binding forkhead associated (FHA) protein
MPAQLIALSDGLRILLDKPILLLGRDAECDIQFESRKISRRHCCIAQVGERLVVRDLGSTNGIRINGVRVLEGYLKAGDELSIGNLRYQVSWDGALAGSARSNERRKQDKGEPRRPAKPAADDDLLESCDEPVPLVDSGRRPAAKSIPLEPLEPAAPHRPSEAPGDALAAPPLPPVLPEQLKLAASDSYHPSPPPLPPGQ